MHRLCSVGGRISHILVLNVLLDPLLLQFERITGSVGGLICHETGITSTTLVFIFLVTLTLVRHR